MKYLLCNLSFSIGETLKNHYIWQHLVNENDVYIKGLFTLDTNYKGCDICMIDFDNSRSRKNHMFLFHCNQMGGNRGNQQFSVNILRRGPIKYFTISSNQLKNFYNFFEEQIVDDFLNSVYARFEPNDQYKIQGYAEIINQQHGEFIVAESTRVWLANTYTAKHFNDYVRNSLKSEIVKRIIANGLTGSG